MMIWCHQRSSHRKSTRIATRTRPQSQSSDSSSQSADYAELDNLKSRGGSCIRIMKRSRQKRACRRTNEYESETTDPDYEYIDDSTDTDYSAPLRDSDGNDNFLHPKIVHKSLIRTEIFENIEVRFTECNLNEAEAFEFATNPLPELVPPMDIFTNGATFIFHAGMDLLLRNLSAVLWYTASKMEHEQHVKDGKTVETIKSNGPLMTSTPRSGFPVNNNNISLANNNCSSAPAMTTAASARHPGGGTAARSLVAVRSAGSAATASPTAAAAARDAMHLSYITERIIALWFPADTTGPAYREGQKQAAQMLQTKHGPNYVVLNLSSPRRALRKHHRDVRELGWPPGLAPQLERLGGVCKDLQSWLRGDPQRIAVLHARGARERIALVVAAYMHHSNICGGPDQALDRFAMRRYLCEHGSVEQPSHRRYVDYFSGLLSGNIRLNAAPLYLTHVTVLGAPSFEPGLSPAELQTPNTTLLPPPVPGGCRAFIKVYEGLVPVHTSAVHCVAATARQFTISVAAERGRRGLQLRGDVLVKCYHRHFRSRDPSKPLTASGDREVIFACQFHTCAVSDFTLSFTRHELDLACDDLRFPLDGAVELHFSSTPEIRQPSPAPTPAVPTLDSTDDPVARWDSYEHLASGTQHDPDSDDDEPDGDEPEVSHTQGPIDGSLYATVGKKPLPLSADSVYTTSMDSGISSAGNGLQPTSAETTNVGCLSSENQRALDELLNDMLLTVEGIPDLKPNAALYQSRTPTKNDLQRQQRPGGDARYLACCPVSASARQSTNERGREHDRSFSGTSPKTSVTTPNQDNTLDEIPYHARQDSRPFTYSAIPHDAMTHGQTSVLSSPGLVRKASFKTPNGVAVPVGSALSNGGARIYNDYSRTPLDGSRSPELLDGGDRRAQHLTWLQRQQKKLRERREYALRSQRQPHEARLLSELRALHGASHRPDGYTSDTTMFADEDEEDFSIPLHINTTGAKLIGGSSAPGSPLLNRSTRRQQPPYALNRQKSDCSFDREKPFAAVKRFHEENARRYADTSPPETPRTTVPSQLNHNQDHRVLTTNNQYNYLYLQNNGVDEVDFPSTLIEDDRRRISVRHKGVFDVQPKHTTITYAPHQHQPLRLDSSTYNSNVNGVRTHTDILNGNVLDNYRRVNGVNGNGPVRSPTRSPHRPDDLLIFEDADDLRRSTQDDPQNALVCLMASLNASPAASPTASTNSASASSMSSVSVLTPSPPTEGTSVPSVASTTAPCSTQLHARSNNATEFGTNSTPAFCAWQTYQREDSYSSWRSDDSGTPRPNTPAFPVYPRTPYANNGVHHFDTTGLPPKSPTTQRRSNSAYRSLRRWPSNSSVSSKDRSPSPSSEHVLSHSSSTTSVVQQQSPKSIPQNGGQMSPTVYSNVSRRSSTPTEPPQYVLPQHVKFVRDTSRFWYKPNISREEAIATLRDAPPGTFVVRDSNSFPGAFGLALKVAIPPATVAQKAAYFSGDPTELVRHFLIEPTSRGVRLKGCTNEPVFSSLSALVYQHSLMPMALPCKLLLPEGEPIATMKQISDVSGANTQFTQGAACNVLYLLTLDTESLTGPQAIRRAVQQLYMMRPLPIATVVHFKVSSQGITLTDNKRRLFFRRHYPTTTLSHCGLDPDDHRWSQKDPNTGIPISSNRVFGFVARKPASKADNQCHIFADLEPEQPANAIVNFVCKVMATSGSVKSNMV